jgi:CTP synthase
MPETKYVFISGGVLSGLGKGLTTASVALLLKSRGYRVTPVKCENYLNPDAGLINPIEHGDTFLCHDGAETDMDIGSYERFLDENLSRDNFITMGQIYQTVINQERAFYYQGEDVEAVPHVTNEIIRRIKSVARKNQAEIVVVELGGTAGEYQNALFYEAYRILKLNHPKSVIHIHVSYLPTPPHLGEPKTKPTQLSVKLLNSMAIQPDFIVARSEQRLDQRRIKRLALFCNLHPDEIISSPDLKEIYELPLILQSQKLDEKILQKLNLARKRSNLGEWRRMVKRFKTPRHKTVKVAIVGKYFATGEFQLADAYAALIEALRNAAGQSQLNLRLLYINSNNLRAKELNQLKQVQGIVVPIGWGKRGTGGKLKAIQIARENKIPFLGLCFGMQLAVIEFSRHVLGLKKADSTELNPQTPDPVIHMIPAQKRILAHRAYGGTMRLGAWRCRVKPGTLAWRAYAKYYGFLNLKTGLTEERHRHRYEVNEKYVKALQKAGLIISGRSTQENLVELIELPQKTHPFFLGTQGHPEYKSRPVRPHPFFLEFLQACLNHV